MNGSSKAPWIPYSAEIVADWFGWTVEDTRAKFGDAVLVRRNLANLELLPGPPSPTEMRARVSKILAGAING
jgi:hypothetical protein